MTLGSGSKQPPFYVVRASRAFNPRQEQQNCKEIKITPCQMSVVTFQFRNNSCSHLKADKAFSFFGHERKSNGGGGILVIYKSSKYLCSKCSSLVQYTRLFLTKKNLNVPKNRACWNWGGYRSLLSMQPFALSLHMPWHSTVVVCAHQLFTLCI